MSMRQQRNILRFIADQNIDPKKIDECMIDKQGRLVHRSLKEESLSVNANPQKEEESLPSLDKENADINSHIVSEEALKTGIKKKKFPSKKKDITT